VVGVDIAKGADKSPNIAWEQADLTDWDSSAEIFEKYSPDVVVHCAGIAHQKIGAVDAAAYMRVNSEATEGLAKSAARANPDVCFVFLSSISVYGEGPHPRGIRSDKLNATRCDSVNLTRQAVTSEFHGAGITQVEYDKNGCIGIGEDSECWPSGDYAVSKFDAERRLIDLFDEGVLRDLFILRLAPVYDREWSLNLDRRVFAPGKVAYFRFGSGKQKMSALARPNLVDFIEFISRKKPQNSQEFREQKELVSSVQAKGMNIINVSDSEPYEFNRVIEVFKKSGIRPNRPVISVPLSVVWLATRIAGCLLRNKKEWVYSCYDKLAGDLVFDNGRMLETGFRPRHSLETIMGDRRTETGGWRPENKK